MFTAVSDATCSFNIVSFDREIYNCHQEQWDIYKLDPAYDCFVGPPPKLSVISLKGKERAAPPQPTNGHTRVHDDISDEEERPSHKRSRRAPRVEILSESEEDEVADLISGNTPRKNRLPGANARLRDRARANGHATPQSTSANASEEIQDLSMLDLTLDDNPPPPPPPPSYSFEPPGNKRTYTEHNGFNGHPTKRLRTGSPPDPKAKRHRQSAREKYAERIRTGRAQRDEAFLHDIYAEAAAQFSQSSHSSSQSGSCP